MLALPYGRARFRLDLGGRPYTVLELPVPPPPPPVRDLVEAALDQPIGRPRVETMVRPGSRVTAIISDPTRDEPRAAFLEALHDRLPGMSWTIAIATGTHGPVGDAGLSSLGLPPFDARIVDHDGHRDTDLVDLGTTARGTVARVHRCVVDTDLVIATGCIRPHYFAGFGAGAKAIFPGLGAAGEIRRNHELKQLPGARAGIVDGNPCRADLEEAVGLLTTPSFLLDGVCAADGAVHSAVAGDPNAAFREGVARARPWFTVTAEPAELVFASDRLPVTATVYQAAKIAAAAAPLVKPGGWLIVVAECADGIGPSGDGSVESALEIVNEAILKIGVLPRLAPGVRLGLISSLPAALVSRTLFEPLVMERVPDADSILVIPRASPLLM